MTEGWFDRLIEVLESNQAGKSMRALSIASGRGPNYISQMIANRKQPGAEHLYLILQQFDEETANYVLIGARMSQKSLKMLSMFDKLSDDGQEHFLKFLASLAVEEEILEPEPDYQQEDYEIGG